MASRAPKRRPRFGFERDAATNILLVFLLVQVQSWMSEPLNALVGQWRDRAAERIGHGIHGPALLFVIFAALWLALALWLYRRRRTFLPVRMIRKSEPDAVAPHAHVVFTLSKGAVRFEPENCQLESRSSRLPEGGVRHITCPESIDEILRDPGFLAWNDPIEQLLRGLQPHLPVLRRVTLIASTESRDSAATVQALIQRYKPDARVDIREVADFQNFDDLLAAYRAVEDEHDGEAAEIMIDATGGTKTASIAAALFTLRSPEVEFQYVATSGSKPVLAFNVVTESAGSGG